MPSTIIRQFDYRPEARELDVLFTTGRRYVYLDVPPEAAASFRAAFSKGRHFNARIRGHYPYEEREPAPTPGRIDAESHGTSSERPLNGT